MNRKIFHGLFLSCLLLSCLGYAKTTKPPEHHTAKSDGVNISVTGIKDQTILKNVTQAIKNVKSTHLTKPINTDSIYNIYSNSPDAIKKAMQPYGYFKAKVTPTYKKTNGIWNMAFAIKPGPQSTVSRVNIQIIGSGKNDKNFLNVVHSFPVKKDSPFLLTNYNDGRNLIFEHAANLGYFSSKMINSKIYADLINNTVQIHIKFDTGIRYRFGKTTFSKNPFNDNFLKKYLNYKPGQYYRSYKVQSTQNNLSNSNYFSQVVLTPEVKKAHDGVIPMHVQVNMRKRKQYQFGLGYGTDTGPRGTAGFKYLWANSWGHYFDAKLQGSQVKNSFTAGYHIPWPNPAKDLFSLRAGVGNINNASGKSFAQKYSIDYKHTYTRWSHTLSLNYLQENYDIKNLPKSQADLFYPAANITYYSTKNHINPANGLRFTSDLAGTPSALSNSDGFFQYRVESKAIMTFLGNEQLTLSAQYAATAINNLNHLPLSLQLLAGGSETVRGFSYQSIGPGRKMIIGNIEFRQRIFKQLYLAAFFDTGNVTNNDLFKNLKKGAGPGILYRSPIGVIEIDLAFPISKRGAKPRLVFSMGPEL